VTDRSKVRFPVIFTGRSIGDQIVVQWQLIGQPMEQL